MTHKHNNWLQILAQDDFPPKLIWSENEDFKFRVNNEGEDVNKKSQSKEWRAIPAKIHGLNFTAEFNIHSSV